jgi:hypothetical protein
VGDLCAQVMWNQDYMQYKPWLKNVDVQVRAGLMLPMGLKANEDLLLAFPFGNDGSWAFQGAGGIGLTYGGYVRLGLDVELLYLFGNTRCRRVKTESSQTDLFLMTKVNAFKKYGLNQQFNLFFEYYPHLRGLYFRIDYQYLKQNESRLYPCSSLYDTRIINSAENLQDWDAHSMIFQAHYNCAHDVAPDGIVPHFSFFYKKGLSAKRALLVDTLGFQITGSF